jgi:hypothetical protein
MCLILPLFLASSSCRYGVELDIAQNSAGAPIPPDVLLTEAQKRREQATLAALLTPEGGMPHDARLDMRVSSISRPSHR